jgi:hypothetical protein
MDKTIFVFSKIVSKNFNMEDIELVFPACGARFVLGNYFFAVLYYKKPKKSYSKLKRQLRSFYTRFSLERVHEVDLDQIYSDMNDCQELNFFGDKNLWGPIQ